MFQFPSSDRNRDERDVREISSHHPLDEPGSEEALSSTPRRGHHWRDAGMLTSSQSFSLSFLLFVTTLVAIFLATSRINFAFALTLSTLLSVGLIRTMWIVDRRRSEGEEVGFTEQLGHWISSSSVLVLSMFLAAIAFAIALAANILLFYVGGVLLIGDSGLGVSGGEQGLAIGALTGLPLAGTAGLLALFSVLRFYWAEHLDAPTDVRN